MLTQGHKSNKTWNQMYQYSVLKQGHSQPKHGHKHQYIVLKLGHSQPIKEEIEISVIYYIVLKQGQSTKQPQCVEFVIFVI